MPGLARSVPKPLKVPNLACSVPKPLKMPSLVRSVPKRLKMPSLARSVLKPLLIDRTKRVSPNPRSDAEGRRSEGLRRVTTIAVDHLAAGCEMNE